MIPDVTLAGCVILNPKGKLLLIHRNTPERVQWELPGGKIEEDEPAKKAAARELEEELGIKVKIVRELGNKEFQQGERLMHYTWFLARITEGTPHIMEDKYDDLRYFSWDDLAQILDDLSANTLNLLAAWKAGEINVS